MPTTSCTSVGATPCKNAATFACGDVTSSGSPLHAARKIAFAVDSALTEVAGSESPIANHAYSASLWPLNHAWRALPVRISPGHAVVT